MTTSTINRNSIVKTLSNLNIQAEETQFNIDGADLSTEKAITDTLNRFSKNATEFLTSIFNRPTSCIASNEIVVFCSSWEDRNQVIEQAKKLGFKRFATYQPMVAHDLDPMLSQPHPEHKLAVRIDHSETCIFGEHSNKLLSIMKHLYADFQDDIMFTYCYNSDLRFSFSNEEKARECHAGFIAFDLMLRKKGKMKIETDLKLEFLDNHILSIKVI